MFRAINRKLFSSLVCASLLVAGCGGDSDSQSSAAGDATVAPFGAESLVLSVDSDGDGHWDMRSTTTFSYDVQGRAISQTIVSEFDDTADGTPDRQEITTVTYDPDGVLPAAPVPVGGAIAPLKADRGVQGPGIPVPYPVLAIVVAEYKRNDSGRMTLARRTSRHYAYDAAGRLAMQSEQVESDDDRDGTFDRSETSRDEFAYNANGDPTSRAWTYAEDLNGDGTADSRQAETRTWTYDASGKRVAETWRYDSNGDGIPEESEEWIWTNRYEYDGEGRLSEWVNASFHDGTRTTRYSYVDGRLSGEVLVEDSDLNDFPERRLTITYGYAANGRLTQRIELAEDLDNSSETQLIGLSRTTFNYCYDAAGQLTRYEYAYLTDSTAPYDNDPADYASGFAVDYVYDEGRLVATTQRSYHDNSPGDGLYDGRDAFGFILTYDAVSGQLSEILDWRDNDADEVYEETNRRAYTYNGSGQILTTLLANDWNGDGQADYLETGLFAYDDLGRLASYTLARDNSPDGTPDLTENRAFAYSGTRVTITGTSDSGAASTYTLTFGANGIPGPVATPVFDAWRATPQGEERVTFSVPLPALVSLLEPVRSDR